MHLGGVHTDKHTTAVFIGHRDCYNLSEADVIPAVEQAIALGVTTFLNGGMGHFDYLAAKATHTLKAKYSTIKQLWLKAYPAQNINYSDLFDDSGLYALDWHIEHIGVKRAIPERNEYMLQHSSVAICHVVHQSSGAYKTYLKAKDFGLTIIDI